MTIIVNFSSKRHAYDLPMAWIKGTDPFIKETISSFHQKRRLRRVQFSPTVVTEDESQSEHSLSPEECELLWYTRQEITQLRKNTERSLRRKCRSSQSCEESDEFTWRGLEDLISLRASMARKARKTHGVRAVLKEQARQVLGGAIDPDELVRRYQHVSQEAQAIAVIMAARDEAEAKAVSLQPQQQDRVKQSVSKDQSTSDTEDQGSAEGTDQTSPGDSFLPCLPVYSSPRSKKKLFVLASGLTIPDINNDDPSSNVSNSRILSSTPEQERGMDSPSCMMFESPLFRDTKENEKDEPPRKPKKSSSEPSGPSTKSKKHPSKNADNSNNKDKMRSKKTHSSRRKSTSSSTNKSTTVPTVSKEEDTSVTAQSISTCTLTRRLSLGEKLKNTKMIHASNPHRRFSMEDKPPRMSVRQLSFGDEATVTTASSTSRTESILSNYDNSNLTQQQQQPECQQQEFEISPSSSTLKGPNTKTKLTVNLAAKQMILEFVPLNE